MTVLTRAFAMQRSLARVCTTFPKLAASQMARLFGGARTLRSLLHVAALASGTT